MGSQAAGNGVWPLEPGWSPGGHWPLSPAMVGTLVLPAIDCSQTSVTSWFFRWPKLG
jgi:hypothetical protein